ncbi:PrgI family protein [Candidatus Parcubacteria bacterium]|nr:MAG: PrgI family protein [Candidatus Parcubacteria bacterium]
MQQFTVPQFIDVEDKVLGPITVRQFVLIMAGFVIIALGWKLLGPYGWIALSLVTTGIVILFGFVSVHGQKFHEFLISFLRTITRPALRVWNNTDVQYFTEEATEVHEKVEDITLRKPIQFSHSRLAELSLIVDTRGAYQGDSEDQQTETNINIQQVKKELNIIN